MNPGFLFYLVTGRKAPRSPRRARRRGPARDWRYKAWIRSLPCVACNTTRGVEAAHTETGGMAQKASDSTVVPLCALCHRIGPGAYHAIGKREFERRNG